MRIAFILFDGVTWLDLIGVYEPLTKLKSNHFVEDLQWDLCGYTETVKDVFGLEVRSGFVRNNLSGYDAIIVPGGPGTRNLQYDPIFIDWLKTAATVPVKISICTGSLLLGASGFLANRRATTHFNEYAALQPYCREVLQERIVEDTGTITAGAVTSSIDLGLYLCEKWAGPDAARVVREKMDYYPSKQITG